MKFKKPIEVQAGISDGDPTNPLGISGYLLSSDGSNVNWVSPGGLSAETAEAIVQPIKANEALVKGDPLYIVGYQLGQDVNIVAKADSSDVAKMPVVGLADDDYVNQAFGTMTAFGSFNGDFDTTGGTESWAIGDIIFVKPGGGLTNIKPSGTDLIQNVAIVSRVNSQTGELEVIALGRTNDVPNLPTGRLFVGTAANTSLTSDVIYVDDTSDRVGIGTTNPSTVLEVSSSGVNGVDISQSASNASQSGRLFFTTNTASEGFALFNSNGTFQVNSGGIPNNTSGTNRISIIGSSGNVGIGTTSPSEKLEVSGKGIIRRTGSATAHSDTDLLVTDSTAAGSTAQIELLGGNNGFSNIKFADTDSYTVGSIDYNHSSNSMSFRTNSSQNVVINSAGNVGIGTTSPGSKLDVYGGLRLGTTGDFNISQSPFTTSIFYANTITGGTVVFGAPASWQQNVSVQGDLYVQGGNASNYLGTKQSGVFNNRLNPLGDNYLNSGNLGIGTTSPRTKLHVSGLTGDDDPALGSSTAPLFISNTANSYGLNVGVNNVGASWLQAQSNTSSTAYEMSLNPLGGNVGVGQINPSYKLDVTGTGRFTGDLRCLTLIQTSQRDQKKDIADIDKLKAKAIPFKEYKYKSSIDGSERKRYGVIVEDIENDYPELVHTGIDGIKGINYIDLLIKRVAELEKELEDISLIEGPKGDTGAAGGDGKDGNSHLSNITSIAFNPKAGRLEVNISGTVYNFVPSK